ncbi:hypothetical protein B0T24DRAFT_35368 [Lasiosphaeria ovina]|uniref:Uncharacterized protein n=1 Tax=Lasiosphaeria ovina TaxID=92902 RepID=A0AAE0NKC4_9PEZI|nr:hypothetical protein B0T24DRAFT_35368 [Lasiosphaeria ovina]
MSYRRGGSILPAVLPTQASETESAPPFPRAHEPTLAPQAPIEVARNGPDPSRASRAGMAKSLAISSASRWTRVPLSEPALDQLRTPPGIAHSSLTAAPPRLANIPHQGAGCPCCTGLCGIEGIIDTTSATLGGGRITGFRVWLVRRGRKTPSSHGRRLPILLTWRERQTERREDR